MIALSGFLLYLYLSYRNRRNTLVLVLFLLYAMSFGATVLLASDADTSITTISYIYLLLVLTIFIYAFKGSINISMNRFFATKRMHILATLFTSFLIPATIFYGYYATMTMLYVDLSVARIDNINLLPHNIYNTVFAIFSTLYFIPLFIYFIFLKEDKYRGLRILTFISTLSYPLMTLCYSGRDGVLYWAMNVITLFILFRGKIGKVKYKRIMRIIIILIGIFSAVFLTISIARFGYREGGTMRGFISYLGQQSYHFSVAFEHPFFEGRFTLFPGFHRLLGLNVVEDDIKDYAAAGLLSEYNVFGFFVKTIVSAYGKIPAIGIAVMFFFIVRYSISNFQNSGNLLDFLIVFTLFQIPMNGVFYYRQGIGMGDVIYVIFLLGILLFKNSAGNLAKIQKR